MPTPLQSRIHLVKCGDFVPFLCSPEIVTGWDGNTRKPMIEGDRFRKIRQTEGRSDEDVVDYSVDLISGYPSAYDADDMGLIPTDQIGKSFGLSLADASEKILFIRWWLE